MDMNIGNTGSQTRFEPGLRLVSSRGTPTILAVLFGLIAPGAMVSGCSEAANAQETTANTNDAIRNGVLIDPWAPGTDPDHRRAILRLGGCTGTLIHREWVLSAAHCGYVVGRTATSVRVQNVSRQVDEVWLHPSADAALLHLSQPFTDFLPATIYPHSASSVNNQTVSCYGYGYMSATTRCSVSSACASGEFCALIPRDPQGNPTGPGWCVTNTDGLRYGDNLVVNSVSGYYFSYLKNASSQVVLPGDSGGPCFLNGAVVGINKSVAYDLSWANAVNVGAISDWIREVLQWRYAYQEVPAGAVPTGQISDSGTCYSCTVDLNDGGTMNEHAGKLCKYDGRWSCFIGNGGVSQRWDAYDVLTGYAPAFSWSTMTSADALPGDAVEAGWIMDSGVCHVCRVDQNGNKHAGKLCSYNGRRSCFIANGAAEQRYDTFEVMRDRGRNWRQVPTSDPDPSDVEAVPAGSISDSGTCYACSVELPGTPHENTHVGKLCKYDDRWSCFVGNGGTERRYEDYKALVGFQSDFSWSAMTSAAQPPANAVWGGWIQDSGDCYVCRTNVGGNQHVGKLCKYDNRWSCFIGNAGAEQRSEQYEVMTKP